jgi:hypothetical protein
MRIFLIPELKILNCEMNKINLIKLNSIEAASCF